MNDVIVRLCETLLFIGIYQFQKELLNFQYNKNIERYWYLNSLDVLLNLQ